MIPHFCLNISKADFSVPPCAPLSIPHSKLTQSTEYPSNRFISLPRCTLTGCLHKGQSISFIFISYSISFPVSRFDFAGVVQFHTMRASWVHSEDIRLVCPQYDMVLLAQSHFPRLLPVPQKKINIPPRNLPVMPCIPHSRHVPLMHPPQRLTIKFYHAHTLHNPQKKYKNFLYSSILSALPKITTPIKYNPVFIIFLDFL